MLAILSPSKTIDFSPFENQFSHTTPEFTQQSLYIIRQAKQWNVNDISKIMGISTSLSIKVFDYFQNHTAKLEKAVLKHALFAFNGDAYQGMDAISMNEDVVEYTHHHLRIIDGLYGVLRPLDLIQPHRMEMGLKFKVGNSQNLYHFWSDVITQSLRSQLDIIKSNVVVNLASVEYSKAIDFKTLGAEVITPSFLNYRNGEYKMVSFWAKKARGMMTRFIMEHQITDPTDLMGFDQEYYYEKSLSKPEKPVFVSQK